MIRSVPLALGPYKGEIAEAYAVTDLRAALRDPAALAASPGAEILLDGRNKVVGLPAAPGAGRPGPLVLKAFRTRGLKRLESAFRRSKAARAWRGALALVEAGLETPAPVAFLERRRGGFVVESYYLAERVEAAPEIRGLFRELPDADLDPLLAALASTVAGAHARGIVHRDLSDGNVLVRRGPDGSPSFVFLDTNRVRAGRRPGTLARARNLVRLGIPGRRRALFLEAYVRAAGPAVRPRLFTSAYRFAKASFARRLKIKKALRLRALANKLRIQ